MVRGHINVSPDKEQLAAIMLSQFSYSSQRCDGFAKVQDLYPVIRNYLSASNLVAVAAENEDNEVVGCITFRNILINVWQIHVAFEPQVSARVKIDAVKEALFFMRDAKLAMKIRAEFPEWNGGARLLAAWCRFEYEGYSPEMYIRDGMLWGQYIFGLNLRSTQWAD